MFIKQVSIFIANKSGKIADVISVLGNNDIDISALSIADTTDFGIVRLITSDPEKSVSVLKDFGVIVKVTEVIGVAVSDTPGGLAKALNILKENSIEIDYMYAFVGKSDKGALVVMKVNDPQKALDCFAENNVITVNASDVYRV